MIHKLYNPDRQTLLVRRAAERIRHSLDLGVVLQTAVDEVSTLLNADRCVFFWHLQDTQQVQVVCERLHVNLPTSFLGKHAFSALAADSANWNRFYCSTPLANRWSSWLNRWSGRDRQPPSSVLESKLNLLGVPINLLVPVKGQAGSTGFIACLGDRRHRSAAEIELIQAIAEHLEIAVRQAQLYEQTCKQAQQERLVNRITTLTRQSFDLNTILTEALAQLFEALKADRGLVHLVELADSLSDDATVCASLTPPDPALVSSSVVLRRRHLYEIYRPPFQSSIDEFDTHGPITQWVIQHRQQVAISDIVQDDRIGADNLEYQRANIRSSLVVPVQASGQLQAILYLNQCADVRYWSNDDRKLAQAVADQLAISIQQARLYDKMQQQAIASAAQAMHLAETLDHLRETQVQLIRSEKMSSLGQLIAGLAHEINNPVSFIYGNIPYIENYVEDLVFLMESYQTRYPQIAEECQDLAKTVDLDFVLQDLPRTLHSLKNGATRVREIMQTLRSFCQIDQAQRRPTDLYQAIESALELVQVQTLHKIQIVRQYGEVSAIQAYPKLLKQVIVNLLMNAVEALSSVEAQSQVDWPRVITITTATFSDLKTTELWVRIAIADTGCGIDPAVQFKVFDPFFTTKDVGQGTGLGLAISYHAIVNQHQGRLSFQSQLDQGTEFVIEIPIKPSPLLKPQLLALNGRDQG